MSVSQRMIELQVWSLPEARSLRPSKLIIAKEHMPALCPLRVAILLPEEGSYITRLPSLPPIAIWFFLTSIPQSKISVNSIALRFP